MNDARQQVTLPPVVKTVTVALGIEAAFRRFTEGIATWWPMHSHSVGQEQTVSVVLERSTGGRLYERLADGAEHDWGRITAWEPPTLVAFTWHPGRDPSTAQRVEVRFTAQGDGGTVVQLTHRDWERLGDDAERQRRDYDGGWERVLSLFIETR